MTEVQNQVVSIWVSTAPGRGGPQQSSAAPGDGRGETSEVVRSGIAVFVVQVQSHYRNVVPLEIVHIFLKV